MKVEKVYNDYNKSRSGFKLKLYLVVCLFIFAIILSCFCVYENNRNQKILNFYQTFTIKNKLGTTQFKDYSLDKTNLASLCYPGIGNETVDAIIKKEVFDIKLKFKSENNIKKKYSVKSKAKLKIDYESYVLDNKYYSVLIKVYEEIPTKKQYKTYSKAYVFDLDTSIELDLKDVLRSRYLNKVSSLIMEELNNNLYTRDYIKKLNDKDSLKPIYGNFENFILKQNGILFLLDECKFLYNYSGFANVEIPYSDLIGYVKLESVLGDEQKQKNDQKLIDRSAPMIAITFDDGPSVKNTPKILEILKSNNAVATFFVQGKNVEGKDNILKKIIDEGSEIGNHSWDHKQFTKLNDIELAREIDMTQDVVFKYTGKYPEVIRTPYGETSSIIRQKINMPIILWNVDTEDWKNKNADLTKQRAIENIKDGDIILMHDIKDSTVNAVDKIVPEILQKGFQLVTISDLFKYRDIEIKPGQVYKRSIKN